MLSTAGWPPLAASVPLDAGGAHLTTPHRRQALRARVVAAAALAGVLALTLGLADGATGRPLGTRTVALVNMNPRISAPAVRRAAAALQLQANEDLREWWPGPRVKIVVEPASTVGTHAWELVIAKPLPHVPGQDYLIGGAHGLTSTGEVMGSVFPVRGAAWTMSASHELLEMLEDPSGGATRNDYAFEVCDPVENAGYDLRGVLVSDFVTPGWFSGHGGGPWDYVSVLHRPHQELTASDRGSRPTA
jgi:hypothetical protein